MNQVENNTLKPNIAEQLLPGEPWYIDETGQLAPQQLTDEVQILNDFGVSPVVILTNNDGGLEIADLINQSLVKLGYGDSRLSGASQATNQHFPTDVFICVIDYGSRTIDCIVGEQLYSVVSSQDIATMQTKIAAGAKQGNPTAGIENAFRFVINELQANIPDPTTPAEVVVIPKPKATATKSPQVQIQPTAVVAIPQNDRRDFPVVNPDIAIAGGLTALTFLLAGALVGLHRFTKPRIESAKRIHDLRHEGDQLDLQLSKVRDANYVTLIALVQGSFPEEARDLKNRSESYLHNLEKTMMEFHLLEEESQTTPLLSSEASAARLTRYQEIVGRLREHQLEQDALVEEITALRTKLELAAQHISSAHRRFEQIQRWYEQVYEQNKFLPSPDKVMVHLQAMDEEISQATEAEAQLTAAELASTFSANTQGFESAVNEMLKVKTNSNVVRDQFRSNTALQQQNLLTEEQFMSTINWMWDQAVLDLTDDLLYDDVVETTRLIETEIEQLSQFIEKYQLYHSTTVISQKQIDERTALGFTITDSVRSAQQDSQNVLQNALRTIGKHPSWDRVYQQLTEATIASRKAADQFIAWTQLHDSNQSALMILNRDVHDLEKARSDYQSDWHSLQEYPETNYADIINNYGTAEQILNTLHDDPSDVTDLVSQTERANSMEQQQFGDAETKLAELRKELSTAQTLFETIRERLHTIRQIEAQTDQAVKNAQQAITTARQSYAGESDRLVTEETELVVNTAEQQLKRGKQLLAERNFIEASKQIQAAITQASEALQSAEQQKQALQEALKKAERYRVEAEPLFSKTKTKIDSLPTAAIQQKTHTRLAALSSVLNSVIKCYGELPALEDIALLTKAQELETEFLQLRQISAEVIHLADGDYESYRRSWNAAEDAVGTARDVIYRARQRVSDSRANSQGLSYVQNAEQITLEMPREGASYDQLRQIYDNAQRAISQARTGMDLAQNEIDSYAAAERRRREAERRAQEEAERARRRREEEEAAEQRRRERATWTYSSPSSSSRPSYGSGSSWSHSSSTSHSSSSSSSSSRSSHSSSSSSRSSSSSSRTFGSSRRSSSGSTGF